MCYDFLKFHENETVRSERTIVENARQNWCKKNNPKPYKTSKSKKSESNKRKIEIKHTVEERVEVEKHQKAYVRMM
jgi:hypothetical protein